MAIRVALNHRTEYRFDRRVALAPHLVRLRPAPHTRTPIRSYSLVVEPQPHFVNWQQDPFGNYVARFVFPERVSRLAIQVDVVADMITVNPFDFFVEDHAKTFPFAYEPQLARDLAPYLKVVEDGPRLREWLAAVDRSEKSIVDFIVGLNCEVQRQVGYVIRMEPGVQTCEQTLDTALGSCRDSGWLLVQAMRHLGLAARFVSGYLVQLTADVKSLDGPSGPEQDFTDLHAWAEVFVPGAGWIGLDATSGLLAGEGHIPLSCTPDPVSAAPVTGAHEHCEVEFYFHNRVERVHEDPRVTRPYTEEQWQAIDALGKRVDGDIEADGINLTMGGEPTFVSIDDMEGPEWNIAALGPAKRRLAGELVRRLRERFAPGGVLHFGQGKWYPGEPLPRWALSCLWRADGEALWRDPALLATADAPGGCEPALAARFAEALAARLGIAPGHVLPAYEDPVYYLWKEQSLPANVDPAKVDLRDPLERRRIVRLLEQGLGEPAGAVLPLRHAGAKGTGDGWESSAWPLRRDRLYLHPGDSPVGLRLPLDSLPWEHPEKRDPEPVPDPFAERAPLARGVPATRLRPDGAPAAPAPEPDPDPEPREVIHTALCTEVRDGVLHVFLAPVTRLEDWVEMIGAVEATAAELGVAVVLEGYEPPRDPRLRLLQVTPDPGVIEVNIHPAASWKELVANTTELYEEARQTRLGAEKFMLDGRHTGTGGGNHLTLGGPEPAASPFLRRPKLLQSLVTYWQHHPGLSYLFSGAFIGPTSQAPRIDEARNDALYELETAFAHLPDGECDRPWLVDRAVRNLLVDLTGNTHRAEFCVDKLYSPDGPAGRRGLVELRAFEMPPHARMSLVQMLLLRALVARFWAHPHAGRLVRWGTELHDRFMLPHFVERDVDAVVEDLRRWGYPFERSWFAPFVEFRFPVYGRLAVDDVELEVRWAIEPWNVLGEEVTATGTARYVDSSVERLQVTARGLAEGRHAILCNRRRVPLHPTGTRGEYVAGVRYKAWDPPSGLHPSIPAHAPLVFDVVDVAAGRSIGGCTYHVGHPAGRNYETFPVNAYEAEARRHARFWQQGHTPGKVAVPPVERDRDFPYTLDLRRPPASG